MKPHILLFGGALLALLPFSAQAKIERVVEKTFAVSPGGLLTVKAQGGNIRVEPGTGNQVHVVAKERFRADTDDAADEIAKQIQLTMEQSGADVTATAKIEGKNRLSSWFGFGSSGVQIDFVVTVPTKYRADLHTSGGNIDVGDLVGDVDASTSGGNVSVGKIDAPVSVQTSGGNIKVGEAMRSLKATTSGGEIRIDRVTGDADVSTSGGNIHIGSASGVVHAETSGGDVSAHFVQKVAGDCVLKTSGGNVMVWIDPASAFRLDASTSGGSVTVSGIEMEVQHGGNRKTSYVGIAHGGGPELTLRTSGGDVRVSAN